MAPQYYVSEFTGGNKPGSMGLGDINPRTFDNPKDVAKAILEHQKNAALSDRTPTNIEVSVMESGGRRALSNVEHSSIAKEITSLRNAVPSAVRAAGNEMSDLARRGGVVGKTVAAAIGGGLAMAGGANASEVGKEAINAAAPGLGTLALGEGKKQGVLCEAFGQVSGAVAGVGVGLGVGMVSGPGGVVAGVATDAVVGPKAQEMCEKNPAVSAAVEGAYNTVTSGINSLRRGLGM